MTDFIQTRVSDPFAKVPAEMKSLRHWVDWRMEARDEKLTKVPINARTGGYASSTNAATWATFEIAREAFSSLRFPCDGIGFMFSGSKFVGIDLDHCIRDDGSLEPWADEIVKTLRSYTELSPSLRGLHIIVKGKLTKDGNRSKNLDGGGHVEMYDQKRYFTITGKIREFDQIADRQAELEAIHAKFVARPQSASEKSKASPSTPKSSPASASSDLGDEELIRKAKNAKNGGKFSKLWEGDTSDLDADDSRADLALCSELAFWTAKDAARMDRLFRKSGLYRAKWERTDYRDLTIAKAIENTRDVYKPGRNGDPHRIGRSESTPPKPEPTKTVMLQDQKPPTLPDAALALAPKPIARAIDFYEGRTEAPHQFILMAMVEKIGIALGRMVYNLYANFIYPVFYIACIAPSGGIKTTAIKIAHRATFGRGTQADFGFRSYTGTHGSGVALIETLADANGASTEWVIAELAVVLKQAARDGGSDIAGILTTLYDMPLEYVHRRSKGSHNGAGGVSVVRPTLGIIACGQEHILRSSMGSDMIQIGGVNRFAWTYAGLSDSKPVPFPEKGIANDQELDAGRSEIKDAFGHWQERSKGKIDGFLVTLDEAAERRWEPYYTAWKKSRADTPSNLHIITQREPEHARRFGLVRAVLDRREKITVDDLEWGLAMASYSSACAIYLCADAGGGETRRDVRSQYLYDKTHAAGGQWIRIRDLYRKSRMLVTDVEETRRLIEAGNSTGLWELDGPGRAIRCICESCAKDEP